MSAISAGIAGMLKRHKKAVHDKIKDEKRQHNIGEYGDIKSKMANTRYAKDGDMREEQGCESSFFNELSSVPVQKISGTGGTSVH